MFITIRAAAVLLGLLATLSSTPAAELNLLVFGDWGYTNSAAQRAAARQMSAYSVKQGVRFDAALLLGDNFYGKMPGGARDPRWRSEFEEAYDAQVLAMPFYVALGNHDYETGKLDAELAYAKENPQSRWKMPAKWYRVELPAERPLVSVLVLDSDFEKMSKAEWQAEQEWLKRELARPRPGKWLVATAHHPVFSNSRHGDTKEIIAEWEPLFQQHKLDFYLCGHDHCIQHLQVAGHHPTFVVSGGGGAAKYPMSRDDRGPFAKSDYGFLHLTLGEAKATGRLVSSDGEVAHEFTRTLAGEVQVVKDGGVEKKSLLPVKAKTKKNKQ